jgi:hypothetical protein
VLPRHARRTGALDDMALNARGLTTGEMVVRLDAGYDMTTSKETVSTEVTPECGHPG